MVLLASFGNALKANALKASLRQTYGYYGQALILNLKLYEYLFRTEHSTTKSLCNLSN